MFINNTAFLFRIKNSNKEASAIRTLFQTFNEKRRLKNICVCVKG